MSNQQELFEQIQQALKQNDMQTLSILIQGQDKLLMEQFSKRLKNQQIKKKFIEFLQLWANQQGQRKNKQENDDKIRIINRRVNQQSESEENILQKQIKHKKQIILEEKFGYQFFGNVRCLMIAYGDLKSNQEAIKMMCSQIQVLFQIISKFLIELEGQKKIKANQKGYQSIIQLIFKQEALQFEQIFKHYKKAKKATKNKPQQLQSSYQADSSQSEEEEDLASHHMDANTLQQNQYFASLTKVMNQKQYQSYSQCRSINFMQSSNNKKNQQTFKKFINFLGLSTKNTKINMRFVNLLSFICCRFIRKIILQIIRIRNEGTLKKIVMPISTDEVKKIGNIIIEQYQKIIQKIKIDKESEEQKAKTFFINDFKNPSFRSLFPKSYTKSNKSAQEIWAECQHYREMWIQRYKGEHEIIGKIQDIETEIQVKSQYGKFIMKNFSFFKSKGADNLWRKYFTQQKISQQNSAEQHPKQSQPRKKVKLDSLKN